MKLSEVCQAYLDGIDLTSNGHISYKATEEGWITLMPGFKKKGQLSNYPFAFPEDMRLRKTKKRLK